MPNFIATDKQARDIANNEQVTFIELLDKQPPSGYNTIDDSMKFAEYPCSRYICFTKQISKLGRQYTHIKLRYHSGKYPVKESWAGRRITDTCGGITEIIFKADMDEVTKEYMTKHNFKWHSPASMPTKAVRWELDLTVSVKRVQEVREDILFRTYDNSTGNPFQDGRDAMSFPDEWNDLHANPLKTKDGKAFECFPYNDEYSKILEQDKRCELLADWYYWKGLPLTVNNNPFVVVMDGKVKKI